MTDRSRGALGRAFADVASVSTTTAGIDGLPRDPSVGLRVEEEFRRFGSRTWNRIRTLGPLGRMRRWQAMLVVLGLLITSTATAVYFGPASLGLGAQLQTGFIYDRSGQLLGNITPEENRVVVALDSIPKDVQEAFIALEDERFWSHTGIDPKAIARAVFANARGDREGASTITQQLVKNSSVAGKRTLWRKMTEAVTAIRLERRYPKKKILEAYLNSIYLGQGAYGVEAASRLYFGHGVSENTLSQAALLAGITAAPSRYSPRVNLNLARGRRDFALARMAELGFITPEEQQAAQAEKIVLHKPKPIQVRSPLFVDWVRSEILKRFGEDRVYRGGLRVTTSLDLDIQRAAEDAVAQILDRPGDPDASVVALDVATGEVRAMVGGRTPKLGDFNLATQARRQAGSAFKPFVLATALDQGLELSKTYSAPGSIRVRFDSGQVWPVSNFDKHSYGRLSLESATANSVNTVYAQLMRDVGIDEVADMAHRLGITSPLQAVPSLALGTSGVTALEMAGAYSSFANDGFSLSPTGLERVKDGEGNVLYSGDRQARKVVSSGVANGVREALQTAVRSGTGRPARIAGVDAGGKTGTTEDHRDAWFVGFARGFVVAVWVGYQSNAKMERVHGIKVTGNSFPAKIWRRVMTALLAKYPVPSAKARGTTPTISPSPSVAPSPEVSDLPSPSPSPTPPRRKRIIPPI